VIAAFYLKKRSVFQYLKRKFLILNLLIQPAKSHLILAFTSRVQVCWGARQVRGAIGAQLGAKISRLGVGMQVAKGTTILLVALLVAAGAVRAQTSAGEV